MSGILKAIGKVFKKVVSVVKKVALPALMVGAVVMTGGAAIGALPSLGTMLGGLGLSAGVTTALAGAVSSAAVGSVVGGVGAAVSGGDIMKGATSGFLTGAVTGGVLGATGAMGPNGLIGGGKAASGGLLSNATPPGFGGLAPMGTAPGAATGAALESALPGYTYAGGTAATTGGSVLTAAAPAAAATGAAPAAAAGAVARGGGGLLQTALMSPVVGSVLNGIGGGISANETAKDSRRLVEEERQRIIDNYGGGLLSLPANYVSSDRNRPTPSQRFDPRTYGGTYQFDPTQGRVVFVPNPAQQAGG